MPLMTVIFSQFTTIFNDFTAGKPPVSRFEAQVNTFVRWFAYLFVARFCATYQAFPSHPLHMHIWHFDSLKSGSPAILITTNATRVNHGIAEKLVVILTAMSTMVSAFIVALVVQWKLTLIALSVLPVVFIVTGICSRYETKAETKIMTIYSQAGSIAEEVISSIRTVHAFWA